MIKNGIFVVLFGLLISLTALAQEEGDANNRIYWSPFFNLEWSDFLGEPQEDNGIAAESSIGLPYDYSSDGEAILKVNIQVCFLKMESWSKKERQNQVLLQHEQLHFDIAELHRRKIVKRLSEANFTKSNYKELVPEIIEKIWLVEYRAVQDQYDEETNFSRIFKNQLTWNSKIKEQLEALNEYTYTELELSLINFDKK